MKMKSVELQRCARVAIEKCGNVKPGERVPVVTDTMRDQSVAEALMAAALAAARPAGAHRHAHAAQRAAGAAGRRAHTAMHAADIAYLYATYSMTHSSTRVAAQQAGARVITMPGVTEDGFLRTLSVDIDALVRLTNAVSERVARARTARVTTAFGTDMGYRLEHPLAILDGVAANRGDLDAFPPGLFLSVPRAKSASGIAVVDGSITQVGRVTTPVTMTFDNGRLARIEGGSEAKRLATMLAALEDENAYEFAAWGIGTNPGAALVGEDPSFEVERVYGWTHGNTGASATLPGGTVQAEIHLDGIISQPSIWLDDEKILDAGQFVGAFA